MTKEFQDRWSLWALQLVRLKWVFLAVTLIASFGLWGPASRLQLDESIESLYDEKDPLLQAYLENKAAFGGDEFVVVGYQAEEPLFREGSRRIREEELRSIRDFSESLSQVPGVRAESTQDLYKTLRNPRASGAIRVALRLPSTESSLLELSRHVLIGEDNQTVAIVLRLEDATKSPVTRTETFQLIRKLASEHSPPAMVAGEPVQVHDMFRYVERDSWVLGVASSVLLMTVVLVFFRNLRWVLLPILLIQVTLLWTRGILELSGVKLSMVSSMLTSLVTIIAISMMMYITVLFREYRVKYTRLEAFQLTISRLTIPTFWISVTTAIGFAALLVSETTPVRSFAIMMSLGSMLVPLVCLFLLPGGILIGKVQADPSQPIGEKFLIEKLQQLAVWSASNGRAVLLVTFGLTGIACIGFLWMTVETDFSKNFRRSSPIVQSLEFFESRLGGVGTWEVGFTAPPELDEEYLERVRNLANELRELEVAGGVHLTKVVAITDGFDLVPRLPAEQPEGRRAGILRRLTQMRDTTLEERQEFLQELQPEMESSLYNAEQGKMRIVLRSLEQKPAEVKLELIKQVEQVSQKYFPEAKVSGLYVLLANLITSILGDQVTSFVASSLGIAACMALAFSSIRIGWVGMIPNVLPILFVIGAMGWLGIPINIGTAMIASVSIGLTVDTTILYLAEYQRIRQEGHDHLTAVHEANGGTGLALTLANIALIVGFSALLLSKFVPLIYFGALVSAAMLGGLIGNLVLLPILLQDRPVKPAPAKS